jgi:hypothetical protein
MSRRLILLDLALVVLLGFGIAKLRRDWFAFDPAHQVSAILPQTEKFPALSSPNGTGAPGVVDWTEIPTHNPFSFDRNDIAILALVAPEPTKPAGPRPILFGTFNLGNGWTAMLASGQPNNRSSRPLKVGDALDGWTIVQIQDKSVVLEANANRETVIMDPTALIPRDSGRTLASAAPPAPVAQRVNPPLPSTIASQAQGASTPAANVPNPPTGAKRTRIQQTPFGPRIVEEDQ